MLKPFVVYSYEVIIVIGVKLFKSGKLILKEKLEQSVFCFCID